MSAYPVNPYSPQYFSGVNTPPKNQVLYEDKSIYYPYNPPNGQLTAGQDLLDVLAIQADSDFLLFGYYLSLYTGLFQFKLTDPTGYQLTNGYIVSSLVSQSQAEPTVLPVAHFFQASSKITIESQDLSDAVNSFQLVFVGVNRFRLQT